MSRKTPVTPLTQGPAGLLLGFVHTRPCSQLRGLLMARCEVTGAGTAQAVSAVGVR